MAGFAASDREVSSADSNQAAGNQLVDGAGCGRSSEARRVRPGKNVTPALDDAKLNDWNDGRGATQRTLDGHSLELMTVPQ